MIVTTMNDIPGYTVNEVFGEVMGLTVRSRNVGSQIGAQLSRSSGAS
ncbi:MAG TPA: heavy metal-binding domain-containing protein [Gaiellaceae bacterium]